MISGCCAPAAGSPVGLTQVDLSFSDPGLGAAVGALRAEGFFFCAVLPEYLEGDVPADAAPGGTARARAGRPGDGRRAIEQAAAERGCAHAHLDTFSYQARPFYERRGYALFATLDDYPPGHKRFFMRKDLVGPAS